MRSVERESVRACVRACVCVCVCVKALGCMCARRRVSSQMRKCVCWRMEWPSFMKTRAVLKSSKIFPSSLNSSTDLHDPRQWWSSRQSSTCQTHHYWIKCRMKDLLHKSHDSWWIWGDFTLLINQFFSTIWTFNCVQSQFIDVGLKRSFDKKINLNVAFRFRSF